MLKWQLSALSWPFAMDQKLAKINGTTEVMLAVLWTYPPHSQACAFLWMNSFQKLSLKMESRAAGLLCLRTISARLSPRLTLCYEHHTKHHTYFSLQLK